MDNQLKQFSAMGSDDNWRTQSFRQSVVTKIEEVIQRSGMQVARNSSEMENHVFMKAKTREDYMNMVAKLILHVREMSQPKQNQGAPNMQGPNPNQPGPNSQVQNQPGQAPQGPNNQSGMAPDPINALQNLASQGSRNQMMNMGPQGQMQQQGVLGPNQGMGGLQAQMGQQGPIVSQGPQAQTATNLLQTLNQRPQMSMQLQNKLGGAMGMVPNQGQMGNNMVGQMGGMGNPMGSQLQNQLAGPMQGQMMQNMSMPNSMQMSASNNMVGQMPCNQVVGGMGGQMAPNSMQGQMSGQMEDVQPQPSAKNGADLDAKTTWHSDLVATLDLMIKEKVKDSPSNSKTTKRPVSGPGKKPMSRNATRIKRKRSKTESLSDILMRKRIELVEVQIKNAEAEARKKRLLLNAKIKHTREQGVLIYLILDERHEHLKMKTNRMASTLSDNIPSA